MGHDITVHCIDFLISWCFTSVSESKEVGSGDLSPMDVNLLFISTYLPNVAIGDILQLHEHHFYTYKLVCFTKLWRKLFWNSHCSTSTFWAVVKKDMSRYYSGHQVCIGQSTKYPPQWRLPHHQWWAQHGPNKNLIYLLYVNQLKSVAELGHACLNTIKKCF